MWWVVKRGLKRKVKVEIESQNRKSKSKVKIPTLCMKQTRKGWGTQIQKQIHKTFKNKFKNKSNDDIQRQRRKRTSKVEEGMLFGRWGGKGRAYGFGEIFLGGVGVVAFGTVGDFSCTIQDDDGGERFDGEQAVQAV